VLKYTPIGTKWSGFNADNVLILERYSNVLLMKAEAIFRQSGSTPEVVSLVNQVRTRSAASSLSSVTLQVIEDERSREFLWEGCRRTDMIRFGSFFTGTWAFKTTVSADFRKIYPIPNAQIKANPNLVQNTGY